jgi:hypothetical protein
LRWLNLPISRTFPGKQYGVHFRLMALLAQLERKDFPIEGYRFIDIANLKRDVIQADEPWLV